MDTPLSDACDSFRVAAESGTKVAVAATAGVGNSFPVVDKVKRWIIDTGATYHMIDTKLVYDANDRALTGIPIPVWTAGKVIDLQTTVETHVPFLGTIVAYMYTDTVSVLSLGKLVVEHGFHFIWEAGSKRPRMWDGAGNEISVGVSSNVPYVDNVAFASQLSTWQCVSGASSSADKHLAPLRSVRQ